MYHLRVASGLLFLISINVSSRTSFVIADTLTGLQKYINDAVDDGKDFVGLSTFIVAGQDDSSIFSVVAGRAELPSAYDLISKKEVTSVERNVDENTTFMVASVSKLITWTALSMMMDAGKFQLDDDVNDHLSWKLKNKRRRKKGDVVTYRHLYTHTSGIKYGIPYYKDRNECPTDPSTPYPKSLKQMVKKLTMKKSGWYKMKPGSRFEYSDYAAALAAVLVEEHSGMPFAEFTAKYIFEPLGMSSTTWSRPNDGTAAELYKTTKKEGHDFETKIGGYCSAVWPSEQLWTTGKDLAKFSKSMLRRGRLDEETESGATCLYSKVTGQEVYRRISKQTGDGDSGYGWFVGKPYYKDAAGHGGSMYGVTSELYLKFKNNVAIGFLANSNVRYKFTEPLLDELMRTANTIGPIVNDNDNDDYYYYYDDDDESDTSESCVTTWSID